MQKIDFTPRDLGIRSKPHKSGDFKKNILMLLFAILFFFLALEVILRIFSYPTYGFQKGAFVSDEVIGYKPSSNYSGYQSIYGKTVKVNTNSEGMRDFREYSYEKNNKTRILILGDSFSFGNGVSLNESYAEYLREDFKDRNVEVLNLGVPGYGINHEYLTFLESGKKYNPDMVLIQFTNNDWNTHQITEENGKLSVNKSYSLTANSKGFLVSYGKESKIRTAHLFLLQNFKSYSFLYSKLRLLLSNFIIKYWNKEGTPPYFYNINSSQYQEAYSGYYDLISKFKQETNATVVLFAGPLKDYQASSEEIKKEYNLDYEVNPKQTENSIEDIAKKLNVFFIRLDYDSKDIFLPVDEHWNSKGNKMVADKLYQELNPIIEKTAKN